MDTSKKIKMTVTMDVTVPQALALSAMFEHWNKLGSWGASRTVGFFVDGDGNFQPNAVVDYVADEPVPELTPDLAALAMDQSDPMADEVSFDFDAIAWKLSEE